MNLGYRFVEEDKTHVYLLKKKNACGQLIIHMMESKLGHDAPCIKQIHCLFNLGCVVCGCHHHMTQSS